MRQRMKSAATRHQLRHGRAVAGAGLRPAPADRQRHHRAARRTYPRFWQWRDDMVQTRDAGAPDRERLRLAAAHQHQPEQAHALQFPDARRRRRDAAAGGVAAVRGRHRADHAGARRHPARGGPTRSRSSRPMEIMRAAGRDVCDGFEIGVDVDQMLDRRRALPRQAAGGARRCGRRSWTRCRPSAPLPRRATA